MRLGIQDGMGRGALDSRAHEGLGHAPHLLEGRASLYSRGHVQLVWLEEIQLPMLKAGLDHTFLLYHRILESLKEFHSRRKGQHQAK